jgi:hypothetical protein
MRLNAAAVGHSERVLVLNAITVVYSLISGSIFVFVATTAPLSAIRLRYERDIFKTHHITHPPTRFLGDTVLARIAGDVPLRGGCFPPRKEACRLRHSFDVGCLDRNNFGVER